MQLRILAGSGYCGLWDAVSTCRRNTLAKPLNPRLIIKSISRTLGFSVISNTILKIENKLDTKKNEALEPPTPPSTS